MHLRSQRYEVNPQTDCRYFSRYLTRVLRTRCVIRLLLTIKQLGGQLIGFTIPLIILFYITSGIASLPKNSGSLLSKTVALSYGSTIIAGSLAFIVASIVIAGLPEPTAAAANASDTLTSFMTIEIPPLFGVMTALATAFLFGMGISITNSNGLRKLADEGRGVIDLLLAKVIIPFLPSTLQVSLPKWRQKARYLLP